mmetsp:Transcript_3073/g.8940  ORF Transcript_3073/g.8940 Transcript_3073/m.8940 type:complete len:222 (-) Transcript_3073:404-1069(-)
MLFLSATKLMTSRLGACCCCSLSCRSSSSAPSAGAAASSAAFLASSRRSRRASRRRARRASISATRRSSCRSVFCCFFVFTVSKSPNSSAATSSTSAPCTQTMPEPMAMPVSATGCKRFRSSLLNSACALRSDLGAPSGSATKASCLPPPFLPRPLTSWARRSRADGSLPPSSSPTSASGAEDLTTQRALRPAAAGSGVSSSSLSSSCAALADFPAAFPSA